jgi:hypothetical protein
MGQTEKERGESREWALMFMQPVYISFLLYPMAYILIQINVFFYLFIIYLFISSPAVWIMKINKRISENSFFTSFFIPTEQ